MTIPVGSKVKIVMDHPAIGPVVPGYPMIGTVKMRVENNYAIEMMWPIAGGTSLNGICVEGCGAWVPECCLEVVTP